MSHLGQTADLAGAGFHNTSLSRLKDEMAKKIYWIFFEEKKQKVSFCLFLTPPKPRPLTKCGPKLKPSRAQSTNQNRGRKCTILHLSHFSQNWGCDSRGSGPPPQVRFPNPLALVSTQWWDLKLKPRHFSRPIPNHFLRDSIFRYIQLQRPFPLLSSSGTFF